MEEKEKTFEKSQIYNSKRYGEYKDIISVVLKDGEKYTLKDADTLINNFLNKEADN